MVYTVTFNPAVDYVVRMETLVTGRVNRTENEQIFFGGKGINVSAVLKELGVTSKALGFTAGFTGEAIEKGVAAMGIETDFIRLKNGNSRINVKIRSAEETEINAAGPTVTGEELKALFDKLQALKEGDILVLAGSIPSSMPKDTYEKILAELSGKNIRAVVDASGQLLLNVLKYKPFLVKPNNFELGEMFGSELKSLEDIEKYARRLQQMGAQNVLVSMAGDGALLVDDDGRTHTCGVCKGNVVNSVGAGDSMVAGFIAGTLNGDHDYALKLGTAAGGATAFSEGLAKRELIFTLLEELQ